MINLTKKDLEDFEKEIAQIYSEGKIKAPVHLRSGREEALIDIFKNNNISDGDWIFGYWDSHELCLLKGVDRERVKASILAGDSIALCYPDFNILCSGIVGSLMGAAVGVAWDIKQKEKDCHICHGDIEKRKICSAHRSPTVYHFCGEMSAETGIFHEAVKYATNFDLPIKFIVGDNDVSVMTKTREVWGKQDPWFIDKIKCICRKKYYEESKIIYFQYKNGYPHSGLGKLIKF